MGWKLEVGVTSKYIQQVKVKIWNVQANYILEKKKKAKYYQTSIIITQ